MMNRRKRERSIGIAPIFRWICVAVIIGWYGLMLVNVSHRAIRLGQETAEKEERLKTLVQENEKATAHIATLVSPRGIRELLVAKRSSLVRIPKERIVWYTPIEPAEAGLRAVSYKYREQ